MRIIAAGVCVMLACCAANALGTLELAKLKDWTIVVADDAIPSEQFAAREFQSLFKQVLGIEMPIASAPAGKTRNVFIGCGAAMKASPVGFAADDLGEEGLRIRVKKTNLAIAGGRPRGTLYGVYEFFERYLGVRFLTFDDTYFPEKVASVKIVREDYRYVPPFSFRWSFYKENVDRPEFAARLRVNTVTNDEKLGGITRQSLINHSLCKWVTPAEFGKTHPEYFALVDGIRKLDVGGGGPELCVTNPEVIEIVADRVIKELDANPGQQNISVSQNDNDAYCRCPRCEEINQREGTPMGAHLAFVNAVAERVEKKHPNVKIGTLAYWYTRHAPKTIVPRKNMQVQLCSIECCTFHAIDDPSCAKNREFCQDMQAWNAHCDDIWVWNYNTNFSCYDLPFPNLRSIGPNVRFFLNNKVKGVFMQANGNGTSGEMSDLRNYVMARCLWKPGQDSWPLVEEFCTLHYKEAAPPILEYLKMIHDNVAARGLHPNCFPSAQQVGIDPEVAQKAFDYFEQALALAKDGTVRARVEKASICAYKAVLIAGAGDWVYEDGHCRRQWPQKFQNLPERYIALCQKYNLSMANEGTPFAAYADQLKNQAGVAAVRFENAVWRLTILPEHNAQIVEMLHKPTGRDLLAGMHHDDISKGTLQEIGLKGYDSDKPAAFTAVMHKSEVILTKALGDGSTVERRIGLHADAPEAIFFYTKLTHKGPQPKQYQFKVRPEFDPATKSGNSDVVSAYIKDGGWTKFNREWKMDKGPDAELLNKAKGGDIAFFNHEAKFGACLSYNPAQIDHPYLWWFPEWPQINTELFSPAVELAPGKSLELNYTIRFLQKPPK